MARGRQDGEGERGGGRERKSFLLRLPPELMAELRAWSAHDLRSLNAHIEYLLREALKRRKGGGDGDEVSG
jgi:hypothetical protein